MKTIEKFFEMWEAKEIEWFQNMVTELKDLKISAYSFTENPEYKGRLNDKINLFYKEANQKVKDFQIENQMSQKEFDDVNYLTHNGCSDKTKEEIWTKIKKRVNKEAKMKALKLQYQVEKKAGKVLKVDLYINSIGELNGTVQGEKATVNLTTILAGGYNIQRLHVRTIVR
jgi:hypothetical protein